MTESLKKIEGVLSVVGDGTGSAKRKESRKRSIHREGHDTVSISDEARKRCALENIENPEKTDN